MLFSLSFAEKRGSEVSISLFTRDVGGVGGGVSSYGLKNSSISTSISMKAVLSVDEMSGSSDGASGTAA